jgi:hypothetical protein
LTLKMIYGLATKSSQARASYPLGQVGRPKWLGMIDPRSDEAIDKHSDQSAIRPGERRSHARVRGRWPSNRSLGDSTRQPRAAGPAR